MPEIPAKPLPRRGVSFVVPVFNKAPWLPEVLAAIEAQTGDFARQYVFVDDGSTDESLALLRRLTADWPNVVIESQANRGSGAATNRGIALASEPYVKFVDADDLIAREATRLLLDAAQDTGAGLAFGRLELYDPDERPALDRREPARAPEVIPAPLRSVIQTSYFNPTQILVRTDAARAVGGCDERIVFSQEYGLALRLARLGAFARIEATVAFMPREVPGRLSANEGRQLQRVTLALAHHVRDFPDTPRALQRYAYRKCAGRAWKWARRHRHQGVLSAWFWRALLSRLPQPGDYASRIEACARIFD